MSLDRNINRIRAILEEMECDNARVERPGVVRVLDSDLRLLLDAYEFKTPIDGGALARLCEAVRREYVKAR